MSHRKRERKGSVVDQKILSKIGKIDARISQIKMRDIDKKPDNEPTMPFSDQAMSPKNMSNPIKIKGSDIGTGNRRSTKEKISVVANKKTTDFNNSEMGDMDDDEDDFQDIATFKEDMKSRNFCFRKRTDEQQTFLIYPEDHFKRNWDIFIAIVLVFSCLVTPYRVALIEEDTQGWTLINNVVDILFLLDIIIIFNSAYFDDDFKLVHNRKKIA